MTQEIAKAGVAQIQNIKFCLDKGYPFEAGTDAMEALLAALSLLEPVASGKSAIVPVEPTESMALAGTHQRWNYAIRNPDCSREIWRSMLSAASQPKPEGREG